MEHWGEHDDHPVTDWKTEVTEDSTRLGYHDWVANQRALAHHICDMSLLTKANFGGV